MSFRHVTQPLASRLRVLKPISPFSKPWHRTSFSRALDRDNDPTPEEIQAENEHRERIAGLQKRDQEYLILLIANIDSILASLDKAVKVAKDLHPDREDLEKRSGKFSDALRNLKVHLRDQRVDPYPDRSHSSLHEYAERMLTWSEEEKRTALKNLRLQAEVDEGRLKISVDGLVKLVREHRDVRVVMPFKNDAGAQIEGRRGGRRPPGATETQERRALSTAGQSDRPGDKVMAKRGRSGKDAGGKADDKVVPDINDLQAQVDAALIGGRNAP